VLEGRGSIAEKERDFSLFHSMPTNFGAQPIQWVAGGLALGVKGLGMKLTTQLHLVLRTSILQQFIIRKGKAWVKMERIRREAITV
jgi:hypothetical protein